MATFAKFATRMKKRGRQIEGSAARITRAAATRALKALVKGTPVDKGVARSNWRVGIGSPSRSIIQAYAPGKKLGVSETANANAAIAAGVAKIGAVAGVRGRVGGVASTIYISNSVPYINLLNGGSSAQAPIGFIQIAILEARAEIRGSRIFNRVI